MKTYFTSESITEGHPDKVCDQISDSILDALLEQDSNSRCACEVTVEPGAVHIMGEITTNAKVDYEEIARKTIERIGYTQPEYGFDATSCKVSCSIHQQSPDIALGVDADGAGDQGMMFGFAKDDTKELMPLPMALANDLSIGLTALRKEGILDYLRPDGKTQVTVEYDDGIPSRIDAVVVSTQHDPEVTTEQLRQDIKEKLILKILPKNMVDENTKFHINPTGRFVLGGPAADTGLTGRKIIADTYGGYGRHGGGAFSGKDSTKVDRSAAYIARNIAKTIVASGVAHQCEVQLSYAIGVSQPVSIYVDTFGTSKISRVKLREWVQKNYDLSPKGIINALGLRRPIFAQTSAYGHFGRKDVSLPWEQVKTELIDSLKALN